MQAHAATRSNYLVRSMLSSRRIAQLLTILEIQVAIAQINLYPNPVQTLQGFFPGRSTFINGYGNVGAPMVFCPTNCTENENFGTHTIDSVYTKYWDNGYWTDPVYSRDSTQEAQAGLGQGPPIEIQEGVAVFCRKPYDVCDYPGGDMYARAGIERLLAKTTSVKCHQAMKVFLCTLYRRRCQGNVDQNPESSTYQRRGVFPVCFGLCQSAYVDCGFGNQHMALMCGQYIKSGWVQYSYTGTETGECDNRANISTRHCWILTLLLSSMSLMISLI